MMHGQKISKKQISDKTANLNEEMSKQIRIEVTCGHRLSLRYVIITKKHPDGSK
jgi:hypothetical protein